MYKICMVYIVYNSSSVKWNFILRVKISDVPAAI